MHCELVRAANRVIATQCESENNVFDTGAYVWRSSIFGSCVERMINESILNLIIDKHYDYEN